MKTPIIRSFTLGPYETNCYIVQPRTDDSGTGTRHCWIIDASFDPDPLIADLQQDRLEPQALILTHAHPDHIAGVTEVRRAFARVPILIHEAEKDWLTDPTLNLSAMMGLPITAPAADRLLGDGERLTLGGDVWTVLHTPGHSPGGISLHHEPSRTLFAGDTLFGGSIGRTDFPGSDHDALVRSIRTRLYTLADDTRVFPGHGPATSIGKEKRGNPFVRP